MGAARKGETGGGKNRPLLALALLVAAPLLLAGCREGPPPAPPAASPRPGAGEPARPVLAALRKVAGTVRLTREGASRPARSGVELTLKDRVDTGADGRTTFVYLATSTIRLLEDSSLVVRSRGVRIRRGDVWFNLVLRGRRFVVHVPGCILAVRGTRFFVRVRDDGTTLWVDEGKVEVQAATGTRLLEAGGKLGIDRHGRLRTTGLPARPSLRGEGGGRGEGGREGSSMGSGGTGPER